MGWVLCALEFYISILNRVKVSKIGMVSIDQCLHRIKRGVLDSILEPEGLEVLGKRRNPVLLEVCMLVMLLNVKVYILVKVEVLVVSFVLEGLQFGHNDAPDWHNTLPTKKKSVQGTVHLLLILGLAKFLHVAPPAWFPPASIEDVIHRDHISQETGLKRPVTLWGLEACGKLEVGQVGMQYWGLTAKLVINQKKRAPRLPKRWGSSVSSSISSSLGLLS